MSVSTKSAAGPRHHISMACAACRRSKIKVRTMRSRSDILSILITARFSVMGKNRHVVNVLPRSENAYSVAASTGGSKA